ncbi:MAG: response regulator transcription factor [Clostridia bacterium]|nr:response regulator transcription factor [Clostridia bacterium]
MASKYKILLVEDEENIRTVLSTLLEASGYSVIRADSCRGALMLYTSHIPDLVILDLGLPDGDGREVLSGIRAKGTTPVIVLSARQDEEEKVALLDLGANDYITKPFGPSELLARLRSALRNSRKSAEGCLPGGHFVSGALRIEYEARRVLIGDTEIHLTQTEYNILSLLADNAGKLLTYSAIIRSIWGEAPSESSIKKLQVNMANIRKKFGARPGVVGYITNELGIGYRMNS